MVHAYAGPVDWNLWVLKSDTGCHSGSPGSTDHCAETCTCGYQIGNCDDDDECGGGLECVTGVGASYGFSAGVNVCL